VKTNLFNKFCQISKKYLAVSFVLEVIQKWSIEAIIIGSKPKMQGDLGKSKLGMN